MVKHLMVFCFKKRFLKSLEFMLKVFFLFLMA